MEIHKIKKRLIVQEVMEQMKNLIATRQFKPHDGFLERHQLINGWARGVDKPVQFLTSEGASLARGL